MEKEQKNILENINFTIRAYEKNDARVIVPWLSDKTTFCRWSQGKYSEFPVKEKDMIEYYEAFEGDNKTFPITACDNGKIVGHMLLKLIDEEKKVVRFGCIIVDASKRGKGYGTKMLNSAIEYAFKTLNANEITIGVFEDNVPARKCYEKLGFSNTGEFNYITMLGDTYKCLEYARQRDNL